MKNDLSNLNILKRLKRGEYFVCMHYYNNFWLNIRNFIFELGGTRADTDKMFHEAIDLLTFLEKDKLSEYNVDVEILIYCLAKNHFLARQGFTPLQEDKTRLCTKDFISTPAVYKDKEEYTVFADLVRKQTGMLDQAARDCLAFSLMKFPRKRIASMTGIPLRSLHDEKIRCKTALIENIMNHRDYQKVAGIKSRLQKNGKNPADFIKRIVNYRDGKLSKKEKSELEELRNTDDIVKEAFRLNFIVDNILLNDLLLENLTDHPDFEIINSNAKYLSDVQLRGARDLWRIENEPMHPADEEFARRITEEFLEKQEEKEKQEIQNKRTRENRTLLIIVIIAALFLIYQTILKYLNY